MLGIIFIVFATTLWALDTLIRYPLLFSGVSADRIVFTEHLFLTIFFLPLLLKNKKAIWDSKISSFFYFVIVGVLGSAVGTLAFTKAFSLINPSLVILLQKLQPVVAFTLSFIFLGEKLKKEFLFLALLAIAGGFLISAPDILPFFKQENLTLEILKEKAIIGYMLTLLAVFCWGASTVFGKKLSMQGYDEIQLMGGRFIFGFAFLCFYAYSNSTISSFDWSFIIWGKIFLMVLISGLMGMYFYYKGLKEVSAHVAAIAELFFPLSAVMINWAFLGKTLSTMQIVGGIILTISGILIQLKKY